MKKDKDAGSRWYPPIVEVIVFPSYNSLTDYLVKKSGSVLINYGLDKIACAFVGEPSKELCTTRIYLNEKDLIDRRKDVEAGGQFVGIVSCAVNNGLYALDIYYVSSKMLKRNRL